jgi:hypothetical protein
MPNEDKFVVVITSTEEAGGRVSSDRGIREIAQNFVAEGVKIPVRDLQANLEDFLDGILSVIANIPARKLPYSLEEIEISAEIAAEGEIKLIGGVKAGAKGGVTFRLRKSSAAEQTG